MEKTVGAPNCGFRIGDCRIRNPQFWFRLSFLYAIVNLGLSQISFNTILSNVGQFPRDIRFYLWILLWFQLLPLMTLFLLDVLAERVSGNGKGKTIWRCILCVLLTLSLVRQFQIIHDQEFKRLLSLTLPVAYMIPGVLAFWVCYKWSGIVQAYLSYFGVASLILTLLFVRHGGIITNSSVVAQEATNPGPPVFMILFDELSYQILDKDGHVDRASFPNLAELASSGLWFTNVTTNHWLTEGAVPALLTGHLSVDRSATPSLFERLPRGYRVRIVETEMTLENWLRDRKEAKNIERFQGKSYFLSQSPVYSARYVMDLAYRPFFDAATHFRGVESRFIHLTLFDEMSSFLEAVDSQRGLAQFSFWHASIPHTPFIFAADGSLHTDTSTYFAEDRKLPSAQYDAVMAQYREQVEFSDRVLGVLLDRMKKENLYDKAIVIVVADHGLRVWGDLYRHLDDIARVPLILHGPGIQPGVCDLDVQLIDIVPTLLDLLKAPYQPSEFDGVSAFSASRPQRKKILYVYPQDFAYDVKTKSWQPLQTGAQPQGGSTLDIITSTVLSTTREFSAVQVQNDMVTAHDENEDFLQIYLSRHFPESVSERDLESLRNQAKNSESLADTPSNNFRKGVYYFFVALAETQRISQGRHDDPVAVQTHWETALNLFKKTGDLQPWMAEEIENILKESDVDGNHKLTEQELATIVTSRAM